VAGECIHEIRDADDWVEIGRREYVRLLECEAALERIAAPRRPDGTYNLSRAACEQIAKDALAAKERR
jgi:hypothetical protein